MTSTRHNTVRGVNPGDDVFLDAARATILAVGWRRTTLTDVAKRAGVSRMTVYRRWPDMKSLLGDLLVREWGGIIDRALESSDGSVAEGVVGTVAALRDNELFRRIVHVDPELLLPYLLERRGRNQDHVLELLTSTIAAGQQSGTVRDGEPAAMARALLLALQGFALSAPTMADIPRALLDDELRVLVERYLSP